MLSSQNQLHLLSQHAAEGQDLTPPEIEQAIHDLLEQNVPVETKAEFLLCLARKGETPEEIATFATLIRDLAVDPQIDSSLLGGTVLDTCGTGGDGMNTFNVSTAAAFILAAAGIAVAKHGNRSITSKCGSADVLEGLGIKIEMPPVRLRQGLEKLKIGFLFAPDYHKVFKYLQPVRQHLAEQGKRTIFNLLGPLVNPARPNTQVIGVYTPAITDLYAHVLKQMRIKRAVVVHGYAPDRKSGFDEMSTIGPSKISQLHSNGNVETLEVDPGPFKFQKAQLMDLQGGDVVTNVRIIQELFSGKDKGPKRDFLLYNCSLGFVMAGQAKDIAAGIERARDILESGAALAKLDAYREFSKS